MGSKNEYPAAGRAVRRDARACGTIRSTPTSPPKGPKRAPEIRPGKAFKDPLLGILPTDKLQLAGGAGAAGAT